MENVRRRMCTTDLRHQEISLLCPNLPRDHSLLHRSTGEWSWVGGALQLDMPFRASSLGFLLRRQLPLSLVLLHLGT